MDSTFIIAQIVGAIAFFISVYGINQTNDNRLKKCIAISALVYAVQFYLLGAVLGTILAVLAAFRYWLAAISQKSIIMWLFIILYCVIALFNQEGIVGLFLLGGSIIGTYALFRLQGVVMRYSFIIGIGSASVYNIHYLALASLANDLINATLHARTIYKIKKAQRND